MKIVMHSITPLFPDHVLGGAQKHLRFIATHLGEAGHQVVILSTRREDTKDDFQWHPNVTVRPILGYKQPFPGPYDTGAHNIAGIVQDFYEELQDADRCYIHDGEFLFPFVYDGIPTVVSLRDNVYPETIQGAFIHQPHKVILISEFSRKFVLATAGRFFPELEQRIELIHNGIDWTHFTATPPDTIRQHIPDVDPEQHAIVLHPHRPEETKGMWQTIGIADLLVNKHDHKNLRVLVPQWLGSDADEGVRDFYRRVEAEIAGRGLDEHFVYHGWIPHDLLPEYYTLGHVALSQGSFVETFGNAVYESLGCGTPSVVARIATHRELLPEALIDKNDYGDLETAALLCDDIIRSKRSTSQATLDYLHEHYSQPRQLARYRDVIENAITGPKMPFEPRPIDEGTVFSLAPWCYDAGERGFYHDFRADYRQEPVLRDILRQYPKGFPKGLALFQGVLPEGFEVWYRDGYLVPLPFIE
jgi:glycosyltransferase involved in cell wall biosynthesis